MSDKQFVFSLFFFLDLSLSLYIHTHCYIFETGFPGIMC